MAMSVFDILEQVKTLSNEDRKALAKAIIDLIDAPEAPEPEVTHGHWGENLIRLLDSLGPLETAHPEIEDPVEWVKTVRRDARNKRLNSWADSPASGSE